MAKNKNRKQGAQKSRATQTEQAPRETRSGSAETHSEIHAEPQGSPADVARKQQRRFGHN